jgi:hypothetical protein
MVLFEDVVQIVVSIRVVLKFKLKLNFELGLGNHHFKREDNPIKTDESSVNDTSMIFLLIGE